MPVSASSRPSHDRVGVAEVVDDDDVVTGGDELDDGVRADVARAAADEDLHAAHPNDRRLLTD